MRIIKASRIHEFQRMHPRASPSLGRWLDLMEVEEWSSIQEMRKVFPNADAVKVKSGRIAIVFNIHGNDFRLIAAIHFNTGIVYILHFLTHAEYGRGKWKETL